MRHQRRVLRIGGIKNHLAITQFGQLHHLWVGGIEHGGTTGQHHIDLGAGDLEGLLGVQNVEVPQ